MANAVGTATINFGAFPGTNEASVAVTGQATISATSKVEVFVMADDTSSDHSAGDHKWLQSFAQFTAGTPGAGVGFTIYGRSFQKLQGNWSLRWVWSD